MWFQIIISVLLYTISCDKYSIIYFLLGDKIYFYSCRIMSFPYLSKFFSNYFSFGFYSTVHVYGGAWPMGIYSTMVRNKKRMKKIAKNVLLFSVACRSVFHLYWQTSEISNLQKCLQQFFGVTRKTVGYLFGDFDLQNEISKRVIVLTS